MASTLAVTAAVVLAPLAIIDGVAHVTSGSPLLPFGKSPDDVSDSDKRLRQQAFDAMAPLSLAPVPDDERRKAVETMNLPAEQREAIAPASAADPMAKPASVSGPSPAPRSAPAPSPRPAKPSPPRLAWLTVWDTDVEDGDVIKIESGGYSRTVTLTKAPITFAIPVPASGVVNVTGVSDGDGGGVTVGLASGASTAVFPVMSVGQVLGLRVRLAP